MGIVRSFLRDFGFVHRSEIRRSSRAYAAAGMGRLTADWLTGATTIDHDIRAGMVAVRSRARDLSQNNEFARAYLRAVRKNVVGSEGFALQVKAMNYVAGKPVADRLANSILENAFYDWSKPEYATVTGKMSLRKAEEVIVETSARDGEQFVRIVRGKNLNKYGISLQLIEPDWIDEKYNAMLQNGNLVRMGVELNQWHKPVAYHVTQRNETAEIYGAIVASGSRVRVPASDMIHVFDPERADQTRGISWMTPSMLALHNLKGYVEAAVVNARVGASKMGFFRDPTGAGGEYQGDTVDDSGNMISSVEPGIFEDIGTKEFHAYDPKYPDQQFDPFMKSILRGISSGLGVSFSSLSNDLTDVNFSSIRAGLIEERETWKTLQSWFIESFLNRVYSEWLEMALMTGAVNLPSAKFDKFNTPKWTGRRWSWVDPLKDVEAAKAAVAAGFKSATQIVNEAGGDIDDLYQEIQQEQALADEYGLEFDYGGKSDGNQGTADDAQEGADATDVPPRPGNGQSKGANRRPRLLV
jgi:lambda family phage portal protein